MRGFIAWGDPWQWCGWLGLPDSPDFVTTEADTGWCDLQNPDKGQEDILQNGVFSLKDSHFPHWSWPQIIILSVSWGGKNYRNVKSPDHNKHQKIRKEFFLSPPSSCILPSSSFSSSLHEDEPFVNGWRHRSKFLVFSFACALWIVAHHLLETPMKLFLHFVEINWPRGCGSLSLGFWTLYFVQLIKFVSTVVRMTLSWLP